MKKVENKYLYCILSILIPIFIIFVNFIILKINNSDFKFFSSSEILIADMKTQYLSLMHYFSNVLHGKDSILYSFSNSLGGNMFATYAYYLSSPFNILLFFSNSNNITGFILFFILMKIGLSSFTMYIYLNRKIKNNKNNALIIAVYYSLMSYNVSYYFNIMWLDIVYFLPLVLMGIDDIINKQSFNKYVIFLSLAIISNFYIAYMLCIFCVVYFIYEMVINYSKCDKDKIFRCIKIFLFSSILVGLICSWLLIPTILDLKNMIRSPIGDSMYIRRNPYTNLLIFLSKLFALPNSADNVLSKYTPNVYFGLLPLLLSFSYFYSQDKLKNKNISIVIILFFILSFSTNSFNLLWHGFSFPNGYAYRFSFLFSFFMLLIAYKGISTNQKLKTSKFIIFICLLLFIGFTQINDRSNICFDYLNIILTIIFVILYYILLNFRWKNVIDIVLHLCIIIELVILVNNSFITATSLSYVADYDYYLKNMCKKSKIFKDINYKIDNQFVFSSLDSFSCNDYRLSGALTTNNGDLYRFLHNTGFIVTYSSVANNDNTPIIYSILGINYYFDSNEENSIDYLNYYYDDNEYDTFYLHYNKYALPYGYIIDDKFKENYDNSIKNNPFEYQNAILKSMSGILENSLKPYELRRVDEYNYELTINNDKDIYVYLKHPIPENEMYFAEISIGDEIYNIDVGMSGVFKIENKYEEQTINVKISFLNDYYQDDDILSFYYLNNDVFSKQIKKINNSSFIVSKKEKNKLEGSINIEENGTLFLSIPYENGFEIYVDDKKVDYFKLYDAFIEINLEAGNHLIKIKFIPPGLKIGLFISFIGVSLFILIFIKNKR